MRRRRLIAIAGASLALAGLPRVAGASTPLPSWRWRGVALGAKAELVLVHEDKARAEAIIMAAVDELRRLERIFSLYDENSALSRLNAQGRLDAPPFELLAALDEARHVWRLTGGAFDVTVQPLWQLYAAHFSAGNTGAPARALVEQALARTGMDAIAFDPAAIAFARPGMALTLNGIAQGLIADRVADLLADAGIVDTLVDMGEIRALGHRPDGSAWQVGIPSNGSPDSAPEAVALSDGAIATSSPSGTAFDPAGRFHHLIDPRTGHPAKGGMAEVSVMAARAMRADALSTALAVMPMEDARRLAAGGIEGARQVWLRPA